MIGTLDMDSDKVLITGAGGMLGRSVATQFGRDAIPLLRRDCDVTHRKQFEKAIEQHQPSTVINCAAYTAVDKAESEPEAARALNCDAVAMLGETCSRHGIHFITISTDYVFSGKGELPWPEDAPADAFGPESVYGQTKLEGERCLEILGEPDQAGWSVVRTQWLYGSGGANFIHTISRLAREMDSLDVVHDQVGAPCRVQDVATGLQALVQHRATGFYHVVNSGHGSWYDVACEIVKHLELGCEIRPCKSDQHPRPAKRPYNSRLSQEKFVQLNHSPLMPWKEALHQYLEQEPGRNS
jgi:dTDP-4-dehydrorhamnose reductase